MNPAMNLYVYPHQAERDEPFLNLYSMGLLNWKALVFSSMSKYPNGHLHIMVRYSVQLVQSHRRSLAGRIYEVHDAQNKCAFFMEIFFI